MATYVILSRVSPEAFKEPKGFKKLADEPEEINSNTLKDHPGQIDPVS